ncbi:MAG: YVTN family beta-propeller repeat-containing protein [Bacteroidales bacterium]
MKHFIIQFILIFGSGLSFSQKIQAQPFLRQHDPLFITDLCLTADNQVVCTEKSAKRISVYTPDFKNIISEYTISQTPTGITQGNNKFYITTFDKQGEVLIMNQQTGEIEKKISTGSGTNSPLLNSDQSKLYVLNQFSNNVQEINLKNGQISREVKVLREPKGAVIDSKGKYLFVTNFLPAQRADLDTVAACISVISLSSFKKIKDIQLYNGSNALRGICMSADGKYVFVTHNLGRFQVPTNQLQQGWMNTSGVSILDASALSHLGTVLMDDPERGAAGIWDIHCTPEHMVISHSGTHELSIIDYPEFIRKFEEYTPKSELAYDLRFVYNSKFRKRIPLVGNGPRKFIIDNNNEVIVPTYFSDDLNKVLLSTGAVTAISLVQNRQESDRDKGEKYFNDADHCFQNWQSCNGCHPGDARTDGMNWDLLNDGIGNPKNCKSMLYSHQTAPSMISGIREKAEIAVRKGFTHIQFTECPEEMANCVDEYLKALQPVVSPYLVNGKLSEKAQRGRQIFEKHNCSQCHSGPYFTDQRMYRIGENIEFEKGWDTPTLIEVWRTAPYLFDGRAATIQDVFEKYKHGINQKISKKEIDELAEYVNSL